MTSTRTVIVGAVAVTALLAAGGGVLVGAKIDHHSTVAKNATIAWPRASHVKAEAEATITCDLLSCSHGKIDQPCEVGNYPGIIVQSAPGQLACDPSPPSSFPSASASPAPAPIPAPVGQATLQSTCTPGIYDDQTGAFYPLSGLPLPASVMSADDPVGDAYQVTLTNNSTATADVTGAAVVIYDHTGTEITSDQEGYGSNFITPGQSLTFTEHPWNEYSAQTGTPAGPFLLAPSGAIDQGDTCSVVQWYSGQ